MLAQFIHIHVIFLCFSSNCPTVTHYNPNRLFVQRPSSLKCNIKVFCRPYLFDPTGPFKRIPVSSVTEILKDVLTTYLQEEKYEVEWSQKMTKTISEVNTSCKGRPVFNALKFPLPPVPLVNSVIVSPR